MTKRKSFLVRMDPRLHEVLQEWADDEFRSLNGHIEYLLRQSANKAGRLKRGSRRNDASDRDEEH